MREMDCVEVIAEKNECIAQGVHRGMQGRICHNGCEGGVWLVNFPSAAKTERQKLCALHRRICTPYPKRRMNG